MSEIKAVIFDCDGVISDTAKLHFQAWKQLADEENLTFTWEDYHRMSGTKREENLRLFTEGLDLDEETKQAWLARKVSYFDKLLPTLQPGDELPGISRILDEAEEAGIRVAVASASYNARAVIERLGLTERFEVIGDGYCVVNSKPAQDIFIWSAGGLGLPPKNCMVIEDAKSGVQAALTGGFTVVGVGDGPVQAAHFTVPTLAEIPLTDLIEQAWQARHNP